MQHLEGSEYLVTAKVTHVLEHDGWWVIDAGIPMYRAGLPSNNIKAANWVRGQINVSIDPFDYFERFSRYHAAPALIFEWHVKNIQIETTPIIESGRMRTRDKSRRARNLFFIAKDWIPHHVNDVGAKPRMAVGPPTDRRHRLPEVDRQRLAAAVDGGISWEIHSSGVLSPAVPREESERVLRDWRVWGSLETRGVTSG